MWADFPTGDVSPNWRPQLHNRQQRGEDEEEEDEEEEEGTFVPSSFLSLLFPVLRVWRTDNIHHQLWHPKSLYHSGG